MSKISLLLDKLCNLMVFINDDAWKNFHKIASKKYNGCSVVYIPFNEMPHHWAGWQYDDDYSITDEVTGIGQIFIEWGKFNEIEKVLKSVGLENHVNNLASIVQTYIFRKLLMEANEDELLKNKNAQIEFYNLYKFLSNRTQEIKLTTNILDESLSLKSKNITDLFLFSFAENILKLPQAVQLICDIENGVFDNETLINNILDGAIINLLIYIQTQTDFKENKKEDDLLKLNFASKQYELVFMLIEAAGLLEVLNINVQSPPKDYIRNRVIRLIKKNPLFINHFFIKNLELEKPFKIYNADNPEHASISEYINAQQKKDEQKTEKVLKHINELLS